MKSYHTHASLILILLFSFNMVSCTEALENAFAQQEVEGEQGNRNDQDDEPDFEYVDQVDNSFGDYDMEEDDDCYHMVHRRQNKSYRIPKRRPYKSNAYQENDYGMAIDGSKIDKDSKGWKFQTSPYELADETDEDSMIGVHKDGAPIYVSYDEDDSKNLDNNGGKFAPTRQFPNGIYHYVITLRLK